MIVTKTKAQKLLGRRLKGRARDYYVLSETGKKNMGGPYKTRKAAMTRLRQVEHFKRAHAVNPRGRAPCAGDRVAFTPTTFEMYYYGAQGLEPGDEGTIMASNPYKDPHANVTVQWDKGMVACVPHEAIRPLSGPRRNPAPNSMVTSAAGNPQMDPFGIYIRNPAKKEPGFLQRVGEGALVGGLTTMGLRALGVAQNARAGHVVWIRKPWPKDSPWEEKYGWDRPLTFDTARRKVKDLERRYGQYPIEIRIIPVGSHPLHEYGDQGMLFETNPRAKYDVYYRLSSVEPWQLYEKSLILHSAEKAVRYLKSAYSLMSDLGVEMVDAGAGPGGGASIQQSLFGNPRN